MGNLPQLSVQQKLELETLRRAANGAFAQILLLIAMFTLTPPFEHILIYRITCVIQILSCFFRWVIFQRYKNDPLKLAETNPWNLSVAFGTVFGWIITNGLAIRYFHLASLPGLCHLFITNGILAAVMYSLSPTPGMQRWFISFLGVSIAAVIYFYEVSNLRLSSLLLLLFVVYLILASKIHSNDLKSAYELENRLILENMKLQEIFDSFPGFIFLVTRSGDWILSSKSSSKLNQSELLSAEVRSFLQSASERRTMELDLNIEDEHAFVVSMEKLKAIEGMAIVSGLPITELRKMRTELETQRAKTEYSARLSAIGEMAGGVAHEINNPLTVISLTSEMLEKKLAGANIPDALWKNLTGRIIETSNRISRIVKSLQNLTREDVLQEATLVDVDSIIREIIDVSSEKMKQKGIKLTYSGADQITVQGTHLEVAQVFLNLINNSYDAISGPGEIRIDIFPRSENVFIQISDTGSGISPEIREKLFQPFFSTKPVGEGTGLGLSVVRSTLLKQGGDIKLIRESNPTIFEIRLKRTGR